MGTIVRKVEPIGANHEIVHLGGVVNYGQEMIAYLSGLPKAQADRIVRELEYQHRPRRVIRQRNSLNPPTREANHIATQRSEV